MAVSRNVFSSFSGFFFSPRRRRSQPPGGKVEDPALAQFLSGFDESFAAANAPQQVSENIQGDLYDAFKVKATPRPGYEPASYGPPIFLNIADFVTDPAQAALGTISSVFSTEWADLYANPVDVWRETDEEVLKRLRTTWYGSAGDSRFIPSSLYNAFEQWNATAGSLEELRRVRDIRKNPGYTFMLANRLEQHYAGLGIAVPPLGGQALSVIKATAQARESQLTNILANAENASRSGDMRLADGLYLEAGKLQKAWEEESKSFRGEVDNLFAWHAAGGDLSNTPEAQFRRYFINRNYHYQTLNFLRTWKKDGLPGAFKEYLWKQVIKDHLFKKGTWREFIYLPNLIEKLQQETLGRLLKPLMERLYAARVAFVRLRDRFFKTVVKGVLKTIGERLGLKALAAWLGTVLAPGAGTALGAVIGAVLQFFAGELVSALGGALKLVGAGLLGCVTLIFLGAVFIIVVLGNVVNPWEESPAAVADGGRCEYTNADFTSNIPTAAASKAAAKYGVPSTLLIAIFEHESLPWIAGQQKYVCERYPGQGAAGPMAITDGTYLSVTQGCGENLKDDIAQCSSKGDKLSRCNFDDAFELAARILLDKVGKWDNQNCKQLGTISASSLADVYNSACNYYGSFRPDASTRNYRYKLTRPLRTNGEMSYCDAVCNRVGLCGPNYPTPYGPVR